MIVTTLLGYFILLVAFYADRRLRRLATPGTQAGEVEWRTTRYLGMAYAISILALLAAWVFNALGLGRMTAWVGWLGVLLAFGGLLLRTWANRALGPFYTRNLQVASDQTIVSKGPYRVIRHPGYLGMILMWLGVAASTCNWIVLLVVLVAIAAAYYYRIETEERLLAASLPGYAAYRSRTWRLIPPIY